MSHKLIIIDKKTEEMKEFNIRDSRKYIDYVKEVFESKIFFIELEPVVELLTLEEYKELMLLLLEDESIVFPEELITASDLDYWLQSWKVLDEVYSLSLLGKNN